jgi:hypothetical protein
MLAIGELDDKKSIFFILYPQTSNLTLNFSFAWNRLRDSAKIVGIENESKWKPQKKVQNQSDRGQNDRGTK